MSTGKTIRSTIAVVVCLVLGGCAARGPGAVKYQGAGYESRVERGRNVAVAVAPPDGPALPMARLLAEAAARSLTKRGIPAHALKNAENPPGDAVYLLHGHVVRNLDDARVRYTVLIHWTLSDRKGVVVGRTVQGVATPWRQWEYGDPRVIRFVGRGIVQPVAAMIDARRKARLPSEPLGEGFIFSGVDGAPGDGNRTLSQAMIAALRARDILITSDPRQAVFSIHGQVRVVRQGARDRVTIVWRVRTVSGRGVGQAVQDNTIAPGALDGAWRGKADMIAKAGARGIVRIFNADSPTIGPTIGDDRGAPPAIHLSPVPGRAPPPPE
ncbi:hypothetical protein [Varunaivibrio sulfuroxidans]|uniref:Uncharacterized protein n=1 Tax=Varunaivibrio sulfuroxidans TaxID=1773489 RepID=A0A4V2UN73_9PROT|nr:hypothetical protein [Varunaivibrio sulfuroxidans]TCS60901.1 hypothetical protein EDD55_10961 [Varunaivibrio sulfuroxidans]WES31690.1 hypothetical protein P3M64_04780 [Varunaivibrio sulfuroxidans]